MQCGRSTKALPSQWENCATEVRELCRRSTKALLQDCHCGGAIFAVFFRFFFILYIIILKKQRFFVRVQEKNYIFARKACSVSIRLHAVALFIYLFV